MKRNFVDVCADLILKNGTERWLVGKVIEFKKHISCNNIMVSLEYYIVILRFRLILRTIKSPSCKLFLILFSRLCILVDFFFHSFFSFYLFALYTIFQNVYFVVVAAALITPLTPNYIILWY